LSTETCPRASIDFAELRPSLDVWMRKSSSSVVSFTVYRLAFGRLALGRLALGRLALGRLAPWRLVFGRLALGGLLLFFCFMGGPPASKKTFVLIRVNYIIFALRMLWRAGWGKLSIPAKSMIRLLSFNAMVFTYCADFCRRRSNF